MKKILSSLIMLFPYLFVLISYAIIKAEKSFMTFVIITIIMFIVFLIIYVIMIICMIFKWKPKTAMLINLLIKITYVPVHLILFLIMGGKANPFLVVLMPIPFIISIMFMGITGTVSLVAIIRAYKNGNYKLSKAIIYVLLYCRYNNCYNNICKS